MQILITGAAGYIGAPTTARLIAAGHTVRALDTLRFGGAALLGAYPTGQFELLRGDIRDADTVGQALDGVDAVVHLAAIVGDPACAAEPDLARQVNLEATVALHAAARRAGVGRFIFASTCSVYGHGDSLLDESSPLVPLSLYAQTKAEAETRILTPGGEMATTALRFATLYGLAPRMRFDLVVNLWVRQALTRGVLALHAPQAWRPLIHVSDIAAAVTAVLDAPTERVTGQVFNVASARDNHQLSAVAAMVAEVCGDVRINVAPLAGDARNYRVSAAKLTAATGWTPARTLRQGIAEMAGALSAGVIEVEGMRRAA
ncbi:Nucleoside-diphosphate-sugar epimerase [Streptosporangium subroseum]|uniref:Nucleoside-diphosphate-sugar epimerase n=1 Tax=Streptosporangium subroseum TaxID=106412 RepID=A0A239P070_9ACTN|nr:NAD(P)-dependent oxidoreductase [Streptosporangium subroseum]SNT60521.1 Nucleoside-diphosphate-sugar epimerase [Streptosporangium subroseum]